MQMCLIGDGHICTQFDRSLSVARKYLSLPIISYRHAGKILENYQLWKRILPEYEFKGNRTLDAKRGGKSLIVYASTFHF